MIMTVTSINAQTSAVSTRELTAEEIAEREAYERDVLPGVLLENLRQRLPSRHYRSFGRSPYRT